MAKWKEVTQYSTAVAGLVSGIVLSFFQYFGSGDLSGAVLGYVGQMLTYAAAIFGAAMYWNGKYQETNNVWNNRYNELKRMVKNDETVRGVDNTPKDSD